jgi:hypothetical protein
MTNYALSEIANTCVPPRAMTTALMVACRLGDDTRLTRLLAIAREHGGNILMAQAMDLRLGLLALLLEIDPNIAVVTAKLSPNQIGAVLAELPVQIRENSLDFDGDALAAALHLAANPHGNA